MQDRVVSRLARRLATLVLWFAVPSMAMASPRSDTHRPSEEQRAAIQTKMDELHGVLEELRSRPPLDPGHPDDEIADVAIFHKAADWITRHDEFYTPRYVDMTLQALDTGLARARALLLNGAQPWRNQAGSHVLGYRSDVDGSVQPYAVVVPESAPGDRSRRLRLDVILHGRNATLNEVRFIADHEGKPAADDGADGLVLHVFGRTNNAYRWAGETDVFEAIAAVKRAYPVDERRVVLRGFSMGGAGAWHLGLHHPSLWCAVEAGAGFSESRGYMKRDDFPDYQARALSIYDAVDYALNATIVPMAGYGGELDPQRQASVNIREALEVRGFSMTTEGLVTRADDPLLDFLLVVGAETQHKVDPASAAILKSFRDERARAGRSVDPQPIRFVTRTLKYNQAPWLSIERLKEHYAPATITATPDPATQEVRIETDGNARVIGIDRRAGETVRLDGQVFPLGTAVEGLLPRVYFRRVELGWIALDYEPSRDLQRNVSREKAPGLQGPIDDAFTGPFLCVRGTGPAWNGRLQEWAEARLEQFASTWDTHLRGRIRIKDDVDVTAEDIEAYHLILFGDPGSNALLAEVLEGLPMEWTPESFRLAGRTYQAPDYAPVLIALNPRAPHRYVVVNSGHTFGAREFMGTNALLFPHLGDHATFRLSQPEGEVVHSGYFDESWNTPAKP